MSDRRYYDLCFDLNGDRSNAIPDTPSIDDQGFNGFVQKVAFSDESITVTLDPKLIHNIEEIDELNK